MNHNRCRVDATTDMQHNGASNSEGRTFASDAAHRLVVYRVVSDGAGERIDPVSNPVSISLTGTRIIGEVSLDGARVIGEGGWADPRLMLPLADHSESFASWVDAGRD